MNVYDSAHTLARTIKSSNEYKEYKAKQEKVLENSNTKEMLQDFRSKVMEMQMAQMSGQNLESEKIESIKKLEEIVMANPVLSEYFMTEMRFSQMMSDVYKILGESLDLELDFEK